MNEKISPCNRARRMFQRSAPHPSGPLALPPSPEGKAAYRRGTLYSSPPWTRRGPLHTRPCGGIWLPCVKGAVSQRLTEGSIPPTRLRRATSLYPREALLSIQPEINS